MKFRYGNLVEVALQVFIFIICTIVPTARCSWYYAKNREDKGCRGKVEVVYKVPDLFVLVIKYN